MNDSTVSAQANLRSQVKRGTRGQSRNAQPWFVST